MSKSTFSACVTAKDGLTMECVSRGFKINMDEPQALGGNNTGMNPVEAMLNPLGARKAIVARCFAKTHNVHFTNLRIELTGTLDPDGFRGVNPDAKIGLSEIHTKYYFESDEPDEKLEEFVKFMEKTCPVMDTIVNTPKFVDEIIRM